MAKVGLLILILILMGADAANEKLGASFIFGDSLVDAGNNNYLPTLSKANLRPNGIDYQASGGAPTGRFTNGRTIGDIVGKLGRLSSFLRPVRSYAFYGYVYLGCSFL